MAAYGFDQAIAVEVDTSERGQYSAHLLRDWCIGAVPHGGYLVAVLLNALKLHSHTEHADLLQSDPIQISLAFVIKAQVGPARVVIKELKIGRGYSNYQVALQQQDEHSGSWITLIHALAIMGSFAKETGSSRETISRTIPRKEECQQLSPIYGEFRLVAKNFDYWELENRKDPTTEAHWLGFRDGRPMDALAMGLICDLMTPLPLRVLPDERGWYPTLSLDLQFKKAPKADGLYTFLEVQSESIRNGRFDITTRCFDSNHELIAVSQHAALMVSAARNISKRSSRSSKV